MNAHQCEVCYDYYYHDNPNPDGVCGMACLHELNDRIRDWECEGEEE